jgi:hypothetical protein
MSDPAITIRFVKGDDPVSYLIGLQAGVAMPFAPTHTEALTLDGKFYIGAHLDGGVQARPVGYDVDQLMTLPDGSKTDRLVRLPCTPEQQAAFYSFVHLKIGTPYDWKAIAGFVAPGHEHDFDHVICSAFMTEALRKCGWFKWPLTVPFHRISPSNLFLVLSSHVEIEH